MLQPTIWLFYKPCLYRLSQAPNCPLNHPQCQDCKKANPLIELCGKQGIEQIKTGERREAFRLRGLGNESAFSCRRKHKPTTEPLVSAELTGGLVQLLVCAFHIAYASILLLYCDVNVYLCRAAGYRAYVLCINPVDATGVAFLHLYVSCGSGVGANMWNPGVPHDAPPQVGLMVITHPGFSFFLI